MIIFQHLQSIKNKMENLFEQFISKHCKDKKFK